MGKHKLYELDGVTATLAAFAEEYRIPIDTLRGRLAKGMTLRQAILASKLIKNGERPQTDPEPKQKPVKRKQVQEEPQKRRVVFYKTGSSSGYYDWE